MQGEAVQRDDTFRPFYVARILAPSLILVLVALFQIYRSQAHHLSAWKGGGFGMFASVDSPFDRYLRCYLLTQKGELPLPVADPGASLALKARTLPSARNLLLLADSMLSDAGWIEDQLLEQSGLQQGVPNSPSHQPPQGGEPTDPLKAQPILPQHVRGMRVEVWAKRYDAQTSRLDFQIMAQTTLHSRK